MISFKVELISLLGAKVSTYVKCNTPEQAKHIATERVNKKSPSVWRVYAVNAEYPPEGYEDIWDKE